MIWINFKRIVHSGSINFWRNGIVSLSAVLIMFITLFIIVIGINDKIHFKRALWAFGLGALFSGVIPLLLYPELIGSRAGQVNQINYRGGFWNFALVSYLSVAWILLAMIQKKDTTGREKLFSYSTFIITWIAGFSGLSRSLLLATFTSIIAYLISSKSLKKNIKMLIAIFVIYTIIVKYMPNVVQLFESRISTDIEDISNEARNLIWKSYLENLSRYFLTGALGDYHIYGPRTVLAGPHSVFLNWLVQYGILGFVGFLYLLKGILKEINFLRRISPKEASFLFAWVISYLTFASINQTGFIETSIFSAFAFILTWRKSI
jgi:O-antigen ligase